MSYWYCPQCKRELDGCNVTYHENCAICGARVLSIDEGITPERLEEILAAEREGRCVVLPRPGDRLYYAPYPDGEKDCSGNPMFLRNTGDGSGEVKAVRVQVRFDNWMGWVALRRTFKTSAEAEEALRQK